MHVLSQNAKVKQKGHAREFATTQNELAQKKLEVQFCIQLPVLITR
jgi:hypothetical protein